MTTNEDNLYGDALERVAAHSAAMSSMKDECPHCGCMGCHADNCPIGTLREACRIADAKPDIGRCEDALEAIMSWLPRTAPDNLQGDLATLREALEKMR